MEARKVVLLDGGVKLINFPVGSQETVGVIFPAIILLFFTVDHHYEG